MFTTLYTVHLERHGTDRDVGDRMSGENVRLFILSSDHSQENKPTKMLPPFYIIPQLHDGKIACVI